MSLNHTNINSLSSDVVRNIQKYLSPDDIYSYSHVSNQANKDTEYFIEKNKNFPTFLINEITKKLKQIFPDFNKNFISDCYHRKNYYRIYNYEDYVIFEMNKRKLEEIEKELGHEIEFSYLAYYKKEKLIEYSCNVKVFRDEYEYKTINKYVDNELHKYFIKIGLAATGFFY